MKKQFDCGCVVDENFSLDKMSLDCKATWQLIGDGKTKGVFQLDSRLGRIWAKEIKPNTIEEMGDISALMRPGSLHSMVDGKSMTKHYADRKNGKEKVKPYHPIVDDVLKDTYSVMTYQEQIILLVQKLANFSESEADGVRKGVGKKLAEEIAKYKTQFIGRTQELNMCSIEQANEIFHWIENASRYSFNKCLSLDTIVDTSGPFDTNQCIPIKDIYIGQYILASKLKPFYDGNMYIKVKKVYRGEQNLVHVILTNNHNIKCSIVHKFYCSNVGMQPLWKIIANNYSILNDRYQHCHILSITPIGKQDCIDIEVSDQTHNFIANGLISSNSHAVAYSIPGYWSAWLKTHFPLFFFCSWLKFAKEKQYVQEEIRELIRDAKQFNIHVGTPNVFDHEQDFYIDDKNNIRFGLLDVKGIGNSSFNKLKLLNNKNMTWVEFLIDYSAKINKTTITGLIHSGALDSFSVPRVRMEYEYSKFEELTEKEIEFLVKNPPTTLKEGLSNIVAQGAANKNRLEKIKTLINLLEEPPYILEDTPRNLAISEEKYLGVALTSEKIPTDFDTQTCLEVLQSTDTEFCVSGNIENMGTWKVKKEGPNKDRLMGRMDIADSTGIVEKCMIFPDTWEKVAHLTVKGNSVLTKMYRSKTGDFVVKDMFQL